MTKPMPRLAAAAVALLMERYLSADGIRFVVFEGTRDWPVDAVLSELTTSLEEIGEPLLLGDLIGLDASTMAALPEGVTVTGDMRTVTRWRSDVDRKSPVLLLGKPTGGDFSGGLVLDLRARLTPEDVWDRWAQLLDSWLDSLGPQAASQRRKDLVDEILALGRARRVSAGLVDEYLAASVEPDPGQWQTEMPKELWRIGLFPDSELPNHFGPSRARARLMRNSTTKLMLLTGGSTESETKKVQAFWSMEAEQVVSALVPWRDGDVGNSALAAVQLSDVLRLLRDTATTPRNPAPLDLIDFLALLPPDQAERRDELPLRADMDEKVRVLGELLAKHRVDRAKRVVVEDARLVDLGENPPAEFEREVALSVGDTTGDGSWLATDGAARKLLSYGTPSGADEVVTVQILRDGVSGTPAALTALDEFVAAREALLPFFPALAQSRRDALAYLVAVPEAFAAAADYVAKWKSLLQQAKERLTGPDTDARTMIGGIDGEWVWEVADAKAPTAEGPFSEATLSPIHPSRLEPIATLAGAILDAFRTQPEVVSQVEWALDLAVPVYPLIATGAGALRLVAENPTTGSTTFTGRLNDRGVRPMSTVPTGITAVLDAFRATHPWIIYSGSSTLVVNPPGGDGFKKLVAKITERSAAGRSRIRAVTRSSTRGVATVEQIPDNVEFRSVDSYDELATGSISRADLVLVFLPGIQPIVEGVAGMVPLTGSEVRLSIRKKRQFEAAAHGYVSTPLIESYPGPDSITGLQKAVSAPGRASDALEYGLGLEADEQRLVDRLVKQADWVVALRPGFSISIKLSDETVELARRSADPYAAVVITKDIFPVRRRLEEVVPEIPYPVDSAQLEEALGRLVQASPGQALRLTTARQGALEALGLMVAAWITRPVGPDWIYVDLSLDESAWTTHWLPRGLRADLLRVHIPRTEEGAPVRLEVIESKAKSGSGVAIGERAVPYAEALAQVRATQNSIKDLVQSGTTGGSLVNRVRFRAFAEQLLTAVATTTALSMPTDDQEPFMRNLTRLTRGEAGFDTIEIDGTVVVTWVQEVGPAIEQPVGGIKVIRATSDALLAALAEPTPTPEPEPTPTPEPEPTPTPEPEPTPTPEPEPTPTPEPEPTPTPEPEPTPTPEPEPTPTPEPEPTPTPEPEPTPTPEPEPTPTPEPEPTPTPEPEPTPTPEPEPEQIPPDRGIRPAASLPPPTVDDDEWKLRVHRVLRRYSADVGSVDTAEVISGPTHRALSVGFAPGGALASLEARETDIARDLGATEVSVMNDPGRPERIRVLVLRADRVFPARPRTLTAKESVTAGAYLGVYLGQDWRGEDVISHISTWPHALVAGGTSSGKTTLLRSIVGQVGQLGPAAAKVILFDGKREADYLGAVPAGSYVTSAAFRSGTIQDRDEAVAAFKWLVDEEIPRRREWVRSTSEQRGVRVDPRAEYVRAIEEGNPSEIVPYLVVVDEFAEFMLRGGDTQATFLRAVESLAATGRSVMIHLVLATQLPQTRIVPGPIKANLGTRIALKLPAAVDSVTVFGRAMAEKLAGKGDLIFWPSEGLVERLQGYSD